MPNSTEKISSEASLQAGRSFRKTELSMNVLIGQRDSSKLLVPICQNPLLSMEIPLLFLYPPTYMNEALNICFFPSATAGVA